MANMILTTRKRNVERPTLYEISKSITKGVLDFYILFIFLTGKGRIYLDHTEDLVTRIDRGQIPCRRTLRTINYVTKTLQSTYMLTFM